MNRSINCISIKCIIIKNFDIYISIEIYIWNIDYNDPYSNIIILFEK